MRAFQEQAQIIRKEMLTADVCRITVQAPEIVSRARPGQFVMVRVSAGLDPLLRRPFSIHQISAGGQLQILFKVLGRGTRIMAAVAPRQTMDIVGPLGKGFSFDKKQHSVMVGGGMGIAPLFFLAKSLMQSAEPPDVIALLGAQHKDELLPLATEMESMGITVLGATDDGSLGHHGLVIDLLKEIDAEKQWASYTCGPHPMMKAVANYSSAMGWPCQVSLETMMACGLAACVGCAIPRADGDGYVHACKDGPVFEASEVLWE